MNWATDNAGFSAAIHLHGIDRSGLVRDISQALANEGISVQKANLSRDDDGNINMHLQVTVRDAAHLGRGLAKLNKVKNIQSATRVESMG